MGRHPGGTGGRQPDLSVRVARTDACGRSDTGSTLVASTDNLGASGRVAGVPSHLKSSGERLSDRVAVGVLTQAFLSRSWTRCWRRRAGCSSGTGCRPAGGPFGGTVARLGADEFAALPEREAGTYLSSAWDVAHRILSRSDDAVPDRQHGCGGLGLHRNGSSRRRNQSRGAPAPRRPGHVRGQGRRRRTHPYAPPADPAPATPGTPSGQLTQIPQCSASAAPAAPRHEALILPYPCLLPFTPRSGSGCCTRRSRARRMARC